MVDKALVEKWFARMGARATVVDALPSRQRFRRGVGGRFVSAGFETKDAPTTLDIKRGRFEIAAGTNSNIQVIDMDEHGRHLLLSVIDKIGRNRSTNKFLCGHDERNWFVAGVPLTFSMGGRPRAVTSVYEAKQALKPKELVTKEAIARPKAKAMHNRHRRLEGFGKLHRQGEFFFIPAPGFSPLVKGIDVTIRKERLARGGNPHIADQLVRMGGRQVYTLFGTIYEKKDFERFQKLHPDKAKFARSEMVEPKVYVRGKITHPEHATVDLGTQWHQVMISNETRKNVLFVD